MTDPRQQAAEARELIERLSVMWTGDIGREPKVKASIVNRLCDTVDALCDRLEQAFAVPDRTLVAANRIIHMDYPDDLTQEERLKRYSEDAALCAAGLLSPAPPAVSATNRSEGV